MNPQQDDAILIPVTSGSRLSHIAIQAIITGVSLAGFWGVGFFLFMKEKLECNLLLSILGALMTGLPILKFLVDSTTAHERKKIEGVLALESRGHGIMIKSDGFEIPCCLLESYSWLPLSRYIPLTRKLGAEHDVTPFPLPFSQLRSARLVARYFEGEIVKEWLELTIDDQTYLVDGTWLKWKLHDILEAYQSRNEKYLSEKSQAL